VFSEASDFEISVERASKLSPFFSFYLADFSVILDFDRLSSFSVTFFSTFFSDFFSTSLSAFFSAD
jgi:hypothetical protein